MMAYPLKLVPYQALCHGDVPGDWCWLVVIDQINAASMESGVSVCDVMDAWCESHLDSADYEIHELGWLFQHESHAVQFLITWS